MTASAPVQLHLGCGKRFLPGFLHIDREPYDHLDHHGDIKDLSMFPDGSVSLIYACHCFNYFDDDDARAALAEWRRVLRPGGVLRVAVPDFASITRYYVQSGDLRTVTRLVTGYYKGKDKVAYHRAVYDEATLSALMRAAHFDHVRRYDWRTTSHARIDDYSQAYLPHMDKEKGVPMSLNLEAW
jgi:predicted SAM-dependent methyltransferase